jgi:allophanate hydrolase subunit 1
MVPTNRERTLSEQGYHDRMESQQWATSIVQDGDSCWLVVVGSDVSPSTSARVHALQRAVETLHPAWLVETVPGYCSLGLVVQPLQVSLEEVEKLVSAAVRHCCGPHWEDSREEHCVWETVCI